MYRIRSAERIQKRRISRKKQWSFYFTLSMREVSMTSEREPCSGNRLLSCIGYFDELNLLVRSNAAVSVNHLEIIVGARTMFVGEQCEYPVRLCDERISRRGCISMVSHSPKDFSPPDSVSPETKLRLLNVVQRHDVAFENAHTLSWWDFTAEYKWM